MAPNTQTQHKSAPNKSGRKFNRPNDEADRIGISRRCLSLWMKAGKIPFIQTGRVILFDPDKVDAALAKFEHREVTRD